MPAITVCVINFNGEECLPGTLAAIGNLVNQVSRILVVDNASTDGSSSVVARFPDVQLIPLPENRGPGRARNVGFLEAETDLVLFVDNDVVLSRRTPQRLVEALTGDPEAALAMPRVLYAHEPDRLQYDGASSHFLGLMTLDNADRPVGDVKPVTRPLQSLVTACFLADRSRWGKRPLFDENLFIYLEDHDLGLRARISGHRILSVPARCYHGGGTAGLSLRRLGYHTDRRIENVIRNRWIILLKNYSFRTLLILSPALLVFELFQLAGAVRKKWLRHWLRAVRFVWRNRFAILRNRRAVQSSRRISDREILSGGSVPFSDELLAGGIEGIAGRLMDLGSRGYWAFARHLV